MFDRGWNLMRKFNNAVVLSLVAMFCLFASGVAAAQTTLSATALNFYSVPINTTSNIQGVYLTNNQAVSLTINSIAASPGTAYAKDPSTTCAGTLAAHATCKIAITFSPTALGAQPSTLTITTNASNSPQTVTLSGTGTNATTLSATSLNFYSVPINTTSSIQNVSIGNNQKIPLGITSLAVSGAGYAIDPSTTCGNPGSLPAAGATATCKIAITFKPTVLGSAPGTLTITTDANNSPQIVTLSGTGSYPTTLSATSLNFFSVPVNTTSSILYISLGNNQPVPLAISSIGVSGTGYAIDPSTTCGNPGSLPAAGATASCSIGITFKPTALGSSPGTLTITTNANNSPQTVTLSGTGSSATTLSATSLNFLSVPVNTTSSILYISLGNNQNVPLSITSLAVSAGYALDPSTTCAGSLPATGAAASCKIGIVFKPTALGSDPGTLTITTNANNSPQTVTLSGTGTNLTTLSATGLNFGGVSINTTSAIQDVILTNHQTAALTISSLAVTAGTPYAIDPSSTCLNPTVAANGGFCSIAITFSPVATGTQSSTLTITTNASNSPQTVTLTGAGVPPASLSPGTVWYGSVAVNATSATKTFTLKNYGSATLTITSAVFGGPFALDSSAVTTCPMAGGTVSGTLAGGASCVIGVTFDPVATGPVAGQITLIDSATNSPQFSVLNGNGIAAVSLSTGTVAFGNVAVNTTSATMNVTLTNNQAVALNLSSISVPAPYAVVPATTTCLVGTPVAPNGSCNISLTFSPTAVGAAAASSLTVNDDAANSPQTASLTGSGVVPVTLSPATLAFGTVVVNDAVVKNETLKNNQSVPLTISSITGFAGGYTLNSANTTCPMSPNTLAAGASCVIAVSLTATATGAQPGTISIADDATGSPQSFGVSAIAIQPVVLSPTVLYFPATFLGSTSAAKTVTLTNEQAVALNISGVTITGADPNDFGVTSSCPTAPTALPASSNCPLTVTFTPTGSGTRTATLNIADDAAGSPQTVALNGGGNAPVVVTQDPPFTANVGSTSAYQTFTITNEQLNTALVFSSIKLIGPYIQTSTTCPIGGAGIGGAGTTASCAVTVEFNPTVGGLGNGQFQVYDNTITSPQVVNLAGTAYNPLTISPTYLSFSAQTVGTASAAKIFTLTNHESQPETFSLAAVGSLAAGDYQANSNCPTGIIAANSSCLIYVNFTPTSVTPSTVRGGTLTIANSATNGSAAPGTSPVVGALTGSATATNPPAAVSVVAPGAGAAGTSVNVKITGNGWTHFSPASVISFSDVNSATYAVDIAVSSFTSPNPNEIDATLTLTANTVANPVTYGARNISIATPLSGGGTETANLLSAFIIADPNNAHVITSLNPAFGTQGQTLNVALTATGTNFVPGTTYANFGDGIHVNSLTVTDATDAMASITISNTTYVGDRTVTLVTGGEFAVSSPGAFLIGPNLATLVTVSPNVEPQGFSGQITLTATGTHFLQNATQVSIGGVIVGDVNVQSPTVAVAEVAVPAGAPIGLQNVQIWTGGEIAGLPNAFTITGATPALLSVVPSSGQQGQPYNVVITGNAFTNFVAGQISAEFDGNITSPTVNVISPNQVSIPITISADANVGSITAHLLSGPAGSVTIFPFTFTVLPSNAAITSVTPTCVPQGGQMTLAVTAINTNWVQGTTTATFYPVPVPAPSFDEVTITDATDAQLAVAVPTNTPPGAYGFYMATGGQVVSASMNVCLATPSLTVSPGNGLLPTGISVNSVNVSFTGQFTHFGPATLPVVAGEGVTLTNFVVTGLTSATGTLNIVGSTNGTPTATGPRLITLTTGGEIVTTYFNVTQTPVGLIYISPWEAPQSDTLDVAMVGLNTHFGATTQVQFGPQITVNSVTVTDATHLTANITTSYLLSSVVTPSPAGWQALYVNSAVGTGYTTAAGLPTTTSGAGTGAVVSITAVGGTLTACTETAGGSGYKVGDFVYPTQTGASGGACLVTAVSGTTVTATAVTGGEQVVGGFLVESPAQPSLVSVCITGTGPLSTSTVPCVSSSPQGSTVGVTITGSLTNWVQGQTEAILGAGVTVSDLTITSPTTATATIAIAPTAPVGGNSVIMFTGTQVLGGTAFSVTPNAASIYSVGPAQACNYNTVDIANICGVSGGTGQPYVVAQLRTTILNVVGVGTHWQQGYTTMSFGSGVITDSLTITDPLHATVQITVLSTSPVGFASLTTITGGEVVTLQQAIDIEEGSPILLAISPTAGEQGGSLTVQILGRFTNWGAGTSAAFNQDFPQDIVVNSINVIDAENMTANITVSPWSYVDYSFPCAHALTVTTGTEQVSTTQTPDDEYNFCIQQGAEEITAVSPLSGIQGSTEAVTITGSATNFIAGVTAVSFGDPNFQVGEITVNSPTSLTAPVAITTSASTGFKNITVTTFGQVASQMYSFTVEPGVGTLNEAIPNQAEQGAPIVTSPTCSTLPSCMIRLIGQYTHFDSLSTATFGAGITVQSITPVSTTEVDAYITIDPVAYTGGRSVTVTTPGLPCSESPLTANFQGCAPGATTGTGSEIVTANVFSVIPGPAIISNLSPATGNEGQEVVVNITGEATHWAQSFTQFYIAGGGYDITVNSVTITSATSATVDLTISPTANPGARSIYMSTNGESLTDSGAFVVTGGIPVISYVSPNSALQGTTGLEVTVVGNAYTNWNATSTVTFGPGVTVEPGTFQVDDASHIEAVLDIDPAAQVGYRTVIVQTGTQSLTGNFQVTAPAPPPNPYIWYESPSSGIPGQTLTINFYGLYTQWNPGLGEACSQSGTTLTGFNADVTVNCFQVTSPTSAYATVTISPTATASFSDLTFTTTGTTLNPSTEVDTAGFTVVVAQPYLSIVDPGSGMQGAQNLTVNVLGQFTSFDSTTTFNFGPGITVNGPPVILGPGIATQSISIAQLATLGGRSVVATTPDATAVNQQVVGGAGFSVTPSLALISAVTPNTALQGQTPTVEVTGQNTHWDGSTTFQFGAGIVVTSKVVNSNTDATLTLAIPALAPEGPSGVTATTLGEVAYQANAFVVQAGTPYLLSSGPGSLPQQSSAVFTILSQATQWLANPPTVSYGDGVVLTNVNVTSNTSLTVDGFITPTTEVGYRNLTVTTGTQVLGLNYALYVAPGPAVINSVTANTAGQGATLTVIINGINTHWLQGTTTLTFPNVVINSWSVTSPTSITANITVNTTAPAGEESVTATTLGEVATGVNVFDVTQTQPLLLAVVTSSGPSAGLSSAAQGFTGTVNLTGAFTHFATTACTPNCSVANFGAGITVNSVTASSLTSLQANITVQPTTTLGSRTVSVTTGTEAVSLNNAFNVTVGPAAIVAVLVPASGPQGASNLSVAIVGSQTHWLQGSTVASFGGGINVTGLTITDALHATATISIPISTTLGAYNVTLTTGGEVATELSAFTVTTGAPFLSVVNPPTGHQGDPTFSVDLTGVFTHFNTTAGCAPNCSTVSFGAGITATLAATDATHAVAQVTISPTATIGSRNVTVTTGAETATITGGFSVLAGVPAVISASPGFAQAGTTASIVINGQFTTFQAAFTTVSFGSGITVNFISGVTTTQLTANITVASNATVGARDITVTTNGTPLTLSGAFNVTAGTPVITQVNPNFGNPGQTALSVTITGQYTNWTAASTVTIGTPADGITVVGAAGPGLPGPVTSATATSVTVSLNIDPAAPVGPAGVSVTTGGSTQSVPGAFTVQAAVIPAPSVISLSPGANAGGIPTNSTFTAVFSQPMNRTTFTASTVLLYLTSNQGQGWSLVPTTINVDATGRVLTITPNALLGVNSTYYLNLTSGIKDATVAGNPINSYGVYLYTVFTANTTQPVVTLTNPPASTTVGTNVQVQLEFSTDMEQDTDSGMTVSGPGGPVAGTFNWNSYPYGNPYWGPGNVLYFTPTAALTPSTTYTVTWGAPLADTAGNAVVPGSFTFNTGSGADTATNYPGSDIVNGQTNVGTNVTPMMFFSKPINPLDINTGTLLLYNSDSGKYINGTVSIAPNGLSATYTPTVPLLPDTYYRLYQAGGYYDADGNTQTNTGAYLNGINTYFTTGNGSDLVAPGVASISPVNAATSVPLNAQIIVKFNSPVDPETIDSTITVTPSGGSAIAGTASLASDLVTLFFVPQTTLAPSTVYTVQVTGYADVVGNVGAPFSSTFTTATSIAPINVSTGFNASGNLITANNTADANWVVYTTGITATPSESTFGSPSLGAAQPLLTVGTGDTGFYGGWPVNGPSSDWININPNSTTSNTFGLYYTTFNISGSVPANLCLVGAMGVDDNGLLAINGTAIMGNISSIYSLTGLNIPISSYLVTGTNTLALGWGSTDNNDEAFRLQAVIETCGASLTGGLSLVSATPAYGASGVATNTTITLNFNNPLDPATVNSTTLPIMVGFNSNQEIEGNYVVSGSQVVFTPDSPLPANQTFYVGVFNGPYDLAGDNADTSGLNNYNWITYFNTNGSTATPAGTPFQVMAFSPAAGATNVGLRAPVVATFSRSLNLNSVNNSDYALFNGDSQTPWCEGGSYSHSQDDTSISFNCGALPSSATLTAMLGSGLSDWNGDGLTPYNSQFTTTYYDYNTHGSVISERPGNGAGGVDPNLPMVLYFNLPLNTAGASSGLEVAQNNVAVPGTTQLLDNGYTLEFTPSIPWTPGALIQWWTTGSLTDIYYNADINATSGYFYVAASTATLVPAVQVSSPAEYTNPVPLNTIFDLQFNTPLAPATVNSSNVYVFDNSNGNLQIPVTITQPQPNEIRMVPTSALPVNHYLYVFYGTGLQSTTSVPAVNTQWWEYTGTTSDATLPTVTSAVPYNGATGVGVNVAPGVIFSKTIDPVSVNSNTFQVLNGATPLAGSFWFNSGDTRVEFVPNAPLPANTTLTMSLNGVLDPVGNPVTFSSTFMTGATPDVTTPTVLWTTVSSSESLPTNSAITIQFSTSMDATSFSTGASGDIYIYDSLLGVRVPATLSWNATQSVAYLLPTSPLAAGRQYYFYVNTGTDLAGNQVSGIETTFYTQFTSAAVAPTVINFNPLGGATGVGTNTIIEAQFSLPVDPNFLAGITLSDGGGTVTTSASLSAANTVLQLVPAAPLAPNTTYTLTIAGVKDPAGNTVATVTNSFTTGATYDVTAATVVSVDPPNNASVGTNVVAKMVFNKPLNPITVNNSSVAMYLNDTGQWIPLTVTLSASGLEITLTPQVPLLPNTTYRYYAGTGNYVQDEDGNNVSDGWYYFTTSSGAVSTGPAITVSPLNTATGIPLNAVVIAHISAPIDPTSWNQNSIQLLNGATPVAGTVSEPNGQELIFTPTSALSAGITYTANVSGFTDANGNAVVPSSTTFTTGGTASGGGLTFTGANINNGATVTSTTQQIILTFSQILDPATVNSSTLQVMDTWNSNRGIAGTYAVNGNQVTFTPTYPYPNGAQITVGECGGPTDVLGDVFQNGNCYSQELLYFNAPASSVGDPTTLTVLSVSPASGATNVGHNQAVSVTFNNSINQGTTGGYNTQLYAGQDLQTNGSVTMSADGRTLTFNVGALSNGATYTVAIPAGGVTDEWGNSLTSTFTSSFSVAVDPATGNGSVFATNPGNNTSGVPTDNLLTLYMNRQVNPATVAGSLKVTVNGVVYAGTVASSGGGWEIQFTPTVPFPNSATVQWYFSGSALDIYGDGFNSDSGYFYTAAALNPTTASPQVIAVSPGTGSSLMPTNGEVDIEYNLPIDATTLAGNVYLNSGPATPTFTVALASPNVVRITPNSPWNASDVFYGFCTNGSVMGTNGVAATSDCWATYFYTAAGPDSTSGTVTIGPPNGSVNVGTNAYIRLQFSKPVDRTTINSANVAITTGGNPIPGTWSFNSSGADIYGANFSPVNPLPPSSTIKVVVNGLLDYAGNLFNEPTATFQTAATPDYSAPTATTDFGYWQSGIGTNASFTCLYSEPMDPSSITPGSTYLYSYVTNAHVPVTYTFAPDMMAVTMTPTTPLFADSQYIYYCQNAIDLTGNAQNNNSAGFYTGNGPVALGPSLVYANPPSGMTNVPVNSNNGPWNGTSLMLLFNEPVSSDSMANITFTPQGGSAEPIAVYAEDGNY
ncbi:MAG: Ig-like domain-containing protein, partial [Terracidiphilus sp.]